MFLRYLHSTQCVALNYGKADFNDVDVEMVYVADVYVDEVGVAAVDDDKFDVADVDTDEGALATGGGAQVEQRCSK